MNRAASAIAARLLIPLLSFALVGLSIPSFSVNHNNDPSLGENCKNQYPPYPPQIDGIGRSLCQISILVKVYGKLSYKLNAERIYGKPAT